MKSVVDSKETYVTPSAEKISFNYRDQVVVASSTEGEGGSIVQSSLGIGSPVCGSGGIVDRVFDYVGSSICA